MPDITLSATLNAKLSRMLRLRKSPLTLYAAARIEDLERALRRTEVQRALGVAACRELGRKYQQALAGYAVVRGVLEYIATIDTANSDPGYIHQQLCRAQTAAKTILGRSDIARGRLEMERLMAMALWRELMGPQAAREAHFEESMQVLLEAHRAGLLPAGIGGDHGQQYDA